MSSWIRSNQMVLSASDSSKNHKLLKILGIINFRKTENEHTIMISFPNAGLRQESNKFNVFSRISSSYRWPIDVCPRLRLTIFDKGNERVAEQILDCHFLRIRIDVVLAEYEDIEHVRIPELAKACIRTIFLEENVVNIFLPFLDSSWNQKSIFQRSFLWKIGNE